MSRPEDRLPADLFYNDAESRKYTTSSRIQSIQAEMADRALALLHLTAPSFILDVGCGSGLSGSILSAVPPAQGGPHIWVGMDISASMLGVALERDVEGDLLLADIGQGVPFRAGSFDAAISISAIQWLCNAETSDTNAEGRMARFFGGLYASLRQGGKAVCQFYPRDERQRTMICQAAIKAGFGAGLLVDAEGSKAEKTYLVLHVGGERIEGAVEGLDDVNVEERGKGASGEKRKRGAWQGADRKGSKAWILKKKEKMERQGKIVKPSSKYTGRKRRIQF